jgi:hypothetical protein
MKRDTSNSPVAPRSVDDHIVLAALTFERDTRIASDERQAFLPFFSVR